MENPPSPAIILGLSPTGLVAARSLGRRGIPVFGADTSTNAIGRYSRYVTFDPSLHAACAAEDGDVLADALTRFADSSANRPVLFITDDSYIDILREKFNTIEQLIDFATPLFPSTYLLLDKFAFYRMCSEAGVDAPRTFAIASTSDIEEAARAISYPAILKPNVRHRLEAAMLEQRARKVIHVENPDALCASARALLQEGEPFLVQEVIPGSDENIVVGAYYYDRQGRKRASFTGRKLRQFPRGFGSGTRVVSETSSEVDEISHRLLSHIGFTGICSTEFKRDARDGRLKAIEVNARIGVWAELAGASGVDIVRIAYDDLCGKAAQDPPRQTDGITWSYLPRDVQSAFLGWRLGEERFGDIPATLSGIGCGAVWAPDDKRVALFYPLYALSRFADRNRQAKSLIEADRRDKRSGDRMGGRAV